MFNLENIVRKNILDLKPYSSARDEFSGTNGIFLDANENPFGNLNRYPDPYQKVLKEKLSNYKSIPSENIFIGNGSDEVIDLAFRIFCTPGKDKALTFSPTYGMYDVSAAINEVELMKQPLNESFQINMEEFEKAIKIPNLKLILICSPNNPTGNSIENIERILQKFNGIVLVDEAYIDFSDQPSFLNLLSQYPNLIIAQTFSKAWGLAAARVGIAYASASIISIFNKVKPPYNVSKLNQEAALVALNNENEFEKNKKIILDQKLWLEKELLDLPIIKKLYPSDANFILVETTDANSIYDQLVGMQVITRNRNNIINNCLRITVGSPNENQQLINALKKIA
jgi:histidinol-phosphate aminotransferase